MLIGDKRCTTMKTCKYIYALASLKAFWLTGAKMLSQKRQLHFSPLEKLDIPQLRRAIIRTIKLESKWSGCETADSSPLRCLQVDTTMPSIDENQAITWTWFLHDGVHIICVIGDVRVQLWHLPSNKLVFSFHVGGTLTQASQSCTEDYYLFVGSVDTGSNEE